MNWVRPTTTFARLRPRQARAVLLLAGALAAVCIAVTVSPLGNNHAAEDHGRPSDVLLYRAEVDRIAAGEGYYEAAAAELRARGYPTQSVFNWRMPLPIWLIGKLPSADLGRAMLGLLALALIVLAFEAMSRDAEEAAAVTWRMELAKGTVPFSLNENRDSPQVQAVLAALLLTGPLLLCVLGDLFVMPVLWAGALIGLSLVCFGINRPMWGVAFGVAAVFVRELALLYALLSLAVAWHNRGRREVLAWLVGLTAWGLYFAAHWAHVSRLIGPDDIAQPHGWIQFGGLGFVLATAQINAYLLVLPQWVTALSFVAAMLGLAGWNTPLGRRVALTLAVYVVAFGFVGQAFNQYWGSLTAPLWCLALARFPASLADLWHSAALPNPRVRASSSR